MWENLIWFGKQIQRLYLFENLSGKQVEVNIEELKDLQELFKRLLVTGALDENRGTILDKGG